MLVGKQIDLWSWKFRQTVSITKENRQWVNNKRKVLSILSYALASCKVIYLEIIVFYFLVFSRKIGMMTCCWMGTVGSLHINCLPNPIISSCHFGLPWIVLNSHCWLRRFHQTIIICSQFKSQRFPALNKQRSKLVVKTGIHRGWLVGWFKESREVLGNLHQHFWAANNKADRGEQSFIHLATDVAQTRRVWRSSRIVEARTNTSLLSVHLLKGFLQGSEAVTSRFDNAGGHGLANTKKQPKHKLVADRQTQYPHYVISRLGQYLSTRGTYFGWNAKQCWKWFFRWWSKTETRYSTEERFV